MKYIPLIGLFYIMHMDVDLIPNRLFAYLIYQVISVDISILLIIYAVQFFNI